MNIDELLKNFSANQSMSMWYRLLDVHQKIEQTGEGDLEIGTTPKTEIARDGITRLYRYEPLVKKPLKMPVLLAYALVGRYTVVDLQPDRSLVRKLLEEGLDVYVIDWGHPRRVDSAISLEDYIDGFLHDYVDVIRARSSCEKINLMGICQGGIFHMCFAAMYPEKVNTVTTMVAPYDFHANEGDTELGRGLIHLWARALKEEDVDAAVDAVGNLEGDTTAQAFGLMTPVSSLTKYGIDLLQFADDENKRANFLRMERWLSDRPSHTAASIRQWIKDFYIGNRLAKGDLMLGQHKIDLSKVRCPVLNIYGEHDVISPPICSRALKKLVGSKDYSEIGFPGGHIGVFVGRRAQDELAPTAARWITERSK